MPKQVRSLSIYRKFIERTPTFRLLSPPLTTELAARIGFDKFPTVGDTIMPAVVGRATNFNANGREIPRRDLPMEKHSRMIHTSWKDWHGQNFHGTRSQSYQAYPRDLIPPPNENLTMIQKGADLVATSRVIGQNEPEADIVAVINIFLEIFSSLEIVQPDLTNPVTIRRMAWKILPPGEYPFDRAKREIDEYLKRLSNNDREVITERMRIITRHNPDFVAIGLGGFNDYVVFGFTDRQRYVFESPNSGNATYVFRNDWQSISILTKREILLGGLQEERLIHNNRWAKAINDLIMRP